MSTRTITAPAQDEHADRMAATICETDWDTLLDRLPALDGYLPEQLTAAAARLHQADAVMAGALTPYRAAKSLFPLLPEEQQRHLIDAEEALANCGYLHPSQVQRLSATGQQTVAKRHDARGALADLLFLARTVLEDHV
jgi:hypothetical protein